MRNTGRLWSTLGLLTLTLLISGCPIYGPQPIDNGPPFYVRVVDQSNTPMDSVAVVAYEYFGDPSGALYLLRTYHTNSEGYAELPGSARNRMGYILEHNYNPVSTTMVPDGVYTVEPSERQFVRLGEITGRVFHLTGDGIIALDHEGGYRYYNLSPDVVQEASYQQLFTADMYDDSMIRGNRLWISLDSEGIVLFDISDPLAPERLFSFQVPGRHNILDANDSLIILNESYQDNPLAVYRYSDETMSVRYNIPNVRYAYAKLVGNKVFFANGDGKYAYDISDPDFYQLIYADRTDRQESFRYVGNIAIARNSTYFSGDSYSYDFFDISDPGNPTLVETVEFPHNAVHFCNTDQVFTQIETDYVDLWMLFMERENQGRDYQGTAFLRGYVTNAQLPYVVADKVVWRLDE